MNKGDADNASLNSSLSLRNDDESANTTSTESETFETWTLISEKQKPINTITNALAISEHIDTTANADEEEQNFPAKIPTENDKEIDEFSDGISIISESSESIGRISPHPMLREQLHNMLLDDSLSTLLTNSNIYSLDNGDTDDDQQQADKTQSRRRKVSSSTEGKALQSTSEEIVLESDNSLNLIKRFTAHTLVKSGLSALFYVGVTLALLAFLGRLRNLEWDVGAGKSLSELEQKITELELQHNLMSAEIDLLNKQVKYLSDLNDNHYGGKYEKKNGKTFKAWPGNGKNINPVNINKEDLKRAYQCGENDKFVEIGGICVEKSGIFEKLDEEIGGVVNEILQESETYKSFEKVAEAFLNNGQDTEMPLTTGKVEINENVENNGEKYTKEYRQPTNMPEMGNSKEFKGKYSESNKKIPHKHNKHSGEQNIDSDEDDDVSKERYGNGNGNKRKDNSKERYNKNKYKQGKIVHNNSKERFDNNNYKRQRKPYNSNERFDKSKDIYWQEKLMEQREELRRQRLNQNANNWFIERGDSREQARSS